MGTRTSRAVRNAALVAAFAGLAVVGCSDHPAGPRAVLQMADPNVTVSGGVNVDALTDVGVPLYASVTGRTVRLLSIRLVRAPSAVNTLGVHAYSSRGLGYGQVTFLRGSLPAECPKLYGHPRRVSDVAVRPKRPLPWIVTIVVRITKPGTYVFKHAEISYLTDGTRGWQYQNLNLTLYVRPPPDRRLRIDPTSSIC